MRHFFQGHQSTRDAVTATPPAGERRAELTIGGSTDPNPGGQR